MKRIINTFKYGSAETKRLLAVTFLAGFAALGLVITALIAHSLLFFFGAIICVFITISLAQTFGIHEEDSGVVPPEATPMPMAIQQMDAVAPMQTQIVQEYQAQPSAMPMEAATEQPMEQSEEQPAMNVLSEEEIAKKVKVKATKFDAIKKTKKVNRAKKAKQPKPKKVKATKKVVKACKERTVKRKKAIKFVMKQQASKARASKDVRLDRMKESKTKPDTPRASMPKQSATKETKSNVKDTAVKETKITEEQPTTQMDDPYGIFGNVQDNGVVGDGISATADLLGMSATVDKVVEEPVKKAPLTEEEKLEEMKQLQASDEELAKYNRSKVKKMLRKYKVKRNNKLVLIDRCEKHMIYQTPAYMWLADNMLHLLLIEKEPRHLTLPTINLHEVHYLKKQLANEEVDYAAFKGKSMLAELFRPYLPDYTHSTVVGDLSAYKNLYGIGPGIYFTNRSAAGLFDLLAVELAVEDKVTTSPKVNSYFKDAYKANIMLRDNVIDANGYADRISSILDSMAHSTISYEEFKDTLNIMQKNKLITAEFAMYYMGVRDKL